MEKKTPQHEGKYQQPIMPEGPDEILTNGCSNYACAILDLVAQRPGPKLQQAKSDCDQPTRTPTFDLQRLREGFAVSSRQRYALGLGKPI